MSQYALVQSFHIDHGELDGLRPQECFVLGVEWQGVYWQLHDEKPFTRTIHHRNSKRLVELAEKMGRFCEYSQYDETYGTLVIGTKK